MSWQKEITEKGAALLSGAIGTSFYLSKITVGSGTTDEDLTKQVALLNEKATATSVRIYKNENSSNITFELKNKNVSEEFKLQQIGIWAKQNEDDDDILYMICQDTSETPTVIKTASESPGYTYAATINISVGSATVINVTATEAGTVKYDEVFDEDGYYIGSKIKAEDISNDFMTHNSDDSFCEARLLTVHKQGNVISGKVAISGSFGEASGNDLKWTINSKYKPKQGIVICQCMTIGTQGSQPNAEIGCFIGDDQLELVTGGLYDYEGIVLSFSYIC